MGRNISYYERSEQFKLKYEKLSPEEKAFVDELFDDIENDRMDLANEKREKKTQSISNRIITIFSTLMACILVFTVMMVFIKFVSNLGSLTSQPKSPATIEQPSTPQTKKL